MILCFFGCHIFEYVPYYSSPTLQGEKVSEDYSWSVPLPTPSFSPNLSTLASVSSPLTDLDPSPLNLE